MGMYRVLLIKVKERPVMVEIDRTGKFLNELMK